ncbi:ferredoxin [Desulfonema ishimotonii]|uniref:Ferredoxin n=1 Tax=Desulfonema ishimotonii TaxID=45657 RepID=A0A401FZC8_9BACT|nr:(Fe-S)-binding protein [Desulfonema ishimotonii]GBC62331.1 ferredoxin [Desulfonema ishimotonii]
MGEPLLKTETRDIGLDTGMAKLTPEKIEKVINEVLENETGAKLKVYVDTCVHCGLCSEGCHYYMSNDKNPIYSPAGKVKQTIWEILDKKGKVSPEFIRRAAEIAYTECNLCKRCAMYCPFGIDVAYLMLVVRRICHKLGVIPQYIQDTAHSHAATMNQMWVKEEEWIDTLFWQEEEAAEEIENLRIPLDKEGAEIMYSVIGPEPKFRAQLIYEVAVIMNAAGLDWTMPSMPGWDNSDMAMYTGDNELMGRLKKEHFEAAERLKVKKIVMGECGHAFRSVYDMGNRQLGWKMPPVRMVHALEFYYELFKAGKIKIPEKYSKGVTLHDPCNVIRGRGLHEMSRYTVNKICSNFIEMTPNREHNYCCCAGGGVINCGPPFRNKRVVSDRVKAEQLMAAKEKGAEVVIAPCHNCHGGLEDIIDHYKLDMELKFLCDIIYEVMEKPE